MNPKSKRFPDSMKKLHRLLAIMRILDNREKFTREILAQRFGTCIRTADRDIKDIIIGGFPIIFDEEDNTYRFEDADFSLRKLDLSEKEIMALLFSRQLAHKLGKPFEKAFSSLLQKAYEDTGAKTKDRLKTLEKNQQFWIALGPVSISEDIERQYHTIEEAMDKKQKIEILFQDKKEQKKTKRCIAPYGLYYSNGMWYTLARCELRKDIRSFALDGIKEFRLTPKTYFQPPDFNMDAYFKESWHSMRYGKLVTVVLKFSKEVARWIKRPVNWHPTQVIEEQKDGSLIFRVRLKGTAEIKWWSYHWAPHCEILSPPELRKEAEEEIKALAKIYKK